MHRILCRASAAAALVLSCVAGPADARLIRLDVAQREVVADGRLFGNAGRYERLSGIAHFTADPTNPRNAQVFDIGNAARDGAGHVAFAADFVILKPVDMAKASGTLVFDVNNRGRKVSFQRFHDTPSTASMNLPTKSEEFGNGFFMNRGHVMAWVGWGADMAPGDGRLTVQFPLTIENGRPVTQRILTEFGDRNFNGGRPTTLPLSGGSAFKSFPAVSTNKGAAEAELWITTSDSPRPSGPEIPRGNPVPDTDWALAHCPDGWPGTPSPTDLCVKGGFRNDRNYHLLYRATDSPVMGLGYLTSRDFVSFLRHGAADATAAPNPVHGLNTALCIGISSSGMYLRDFLYQGFNEDEDGRRVCDGMNIHIAGVQKLYLNYRFAQPNPFSQQHRERYIPDTNFPQHYGMQRHPFSGAIDGILKRPDTDPKIIHSDTSNEYWQFRASLTTTDNGERDLPAHAQVRHYLLSSLQHNVYVGDPARHGIGDAQCEQASNPVAVNPMMRALWVALEDWVGRDIVPPASRVPRISDGTLVSADALAWPKIPGVRYGGLYNASAERDFGPRAADNRGIIDRLFPETLLLHRVLVPQVDALGIDRAGVRHPLVDVPLATYTGWNTRTPAFGGDDLCDLIGSSIPLPVTADDARAQRDPRPALQTLYAGKADWLAQLARSVQRLEADRLLLPDDAAALLREAEAAPWPR